MKRTSLPLIPLVLLAGATYLGCQKSDTPDIDNYNTYKTELVTADLSGRIVDENQLPVSDATVKSGNASITTDASGTFKLANLSVDKHAGSITVEKAGYFKAVKTIVVTPNKDNTVSLQLIKKTVTGSFSGASGGNITLPTGGRVVFSSNAIVTDGSTTAYTGTVAVSAFFINPEATNFQEIMPGTLRGITTNNEETGLQSFGMMAVELNGTGGEKLQLAKGKTAGITFPIPASLRASAPATIPLWSLDEKTGLWKEEGFATRQGNDYIGEVGHFSYWNCDAPFKVIDFTATIKTQSSGLADAKVVISATGTDSLLSGFSYTNGEGIVSGKIPANRTLTLKVYNKCGTLLHTKNIGPFSDNTDLGVTTVTSTTQQITISGTVVSCSAAAVTNGYVTINVEGIYYRSNLTNGAFGFSFIPCSNAPASATVIAYDIAGNQSGQTVTVPLTGTTVNTGQLVACGNTLTQYINYTINGVSHSIAGLDSLIGYRSLQSQQTLVSGFSGLTTSFDLSFTGEPTAGPSRMNFLYIVDGNTAYRKSGEITVNVTEYVNTTGGFIAGNFTGNVQDTTTANNTVLPITCTFRVKKTN
ncbi:MAG: carboxypeptidase regulatory-like domain-containing protein [Niastella sp.]|nr:carboxypeptidase regulatory-like domain-containing protein [Niastella sp.]